MSAGVYRACFILPDGSAHEVDVAPDEHLLAAALEAGLDLPYSCLQGWCLTCAARLIDGDVDQADSRRYYKADRHAGYVLPCTGRPRSNVVLVTHARDAMRRERKRHGLPFPRGDWGASAR
jgi:ferredoxin